MPYTSGFAPNKLNGHFLLHGWEFGATSASNYQALADTFLGTPMNADTIECIRARENDKIRYNPVTNEFGVLRDSNIIRTYFKPTPVWHGLPTNLDYFLQECAK